MEVPCPKGARVNLLQSAACLSRLFCGGDLRVSQEKTPG